MKLRYLGHSGFLVGDILIDPFLKDSPFQKFLEEIRCNIICITHDHADHVAGAIEIAQANNASVVAVFEVAEMMKQQGKISTEPMNLGGKMQVGDWEIRMVEAKHSCNLGIPVGFILKNLKEKKTIYHAGDTSLFSDMKLLENEEIDIALLPIGGRFTMDIDDALTAISWIKPKVVIPIHYNTFPLIAADAQDFKKCSPVPVEVFVVGEEKEL